MALIKDRKHTFREVITDNSFIIFMILTFASFAYSIPGIWRVLLWVFLVLSNLRFCKVRSLMDKLIIAYIAGAILSLSGMLVRPYPEDFFLKVFVDSYIPIMFYFIGKNSKEPIQTNFYNRTLIAILFVYVLGFYFELTRPAWWVNKTLEIASLHSSYTEDTIMYARFSSFLDSYHVANFGVFALCFAFGLLKTNNKRIVSLLGYVALGIIIIAILLSRQRVAMFTSGAILLYYFLKSSKNKGTVLGIFGVIAILVLIIPVLFDDTILSQVLVRFSDDSLSSMVSIRTHQWETAINGLMEPVFGNGIGSGGHIAIANGLKPAVADGGYFKVWLEGGIYSTCLFLTILAISLYRAFVHRKSYFVEFPLLLFCMLSLIGANIIDMPYIIAPMWYAIGRINKVEKIKNSFV